MSQTADPSSVEQTARDVPRDRYTPALAQRIELAWEDRWDNRPPVSLGSGKQLTSNLGVGTHVITMVVTYDAAGVRQQAGIHAQRINVIMAELLKGHPINERDLREVLGHTPLEVIGGILLGVAVATVQWLVWK